MDTWQVVKNRFGLISLCFILIFAAAAVLTYIMPRKYRGHVEMTIERITQDINVFDRNRGDSLAFTQEYIKTQFETITKPSTLYPVIEKLELAKRWELPSRQAALAKLRANLETQSMLRSDFVSIDYYDQDSQLAANIANEIAKSYMAQRNNIETDKKQKALTVLQQQISDQEELRRQAQVALPGGQAQGWHRRRLDRRRWQLTEPGGRHAHWRRTCRCRVSSCSCSPIRTS
jgi:succinoglycan biosynthesis transport protein ExoP